MSDIFFRQKSLSGAITPNRASDVMYGMLLEQYAASTNLHEYFLAFIEEMNYLFEETEKVYLGRFFEYAEGRQIDIIGDILGQTRNFTIPLEYFGFVGAQAPGPMADEIEPSVGGVFYGEGNEGFTVIPLDDPTYKRVLLVIADVLVSPILGINTAYRGIITLLGWVPNSLQIEEIATKSIRITLANSAVTDAEVDLIAYMKRYLVPAGTTTEVVLV